MTNKIVPVVMAGGRGTRLWPLSRAAAPKQFIQLIGDKTLFQETLLRVSDPAIYEPAIVVTNDEFRFLVAEQARAIGVSLSTVMLEPVARNTAPAVAAAAILVGERFGEDTVLHVLGSDYEILANESYFGCVRMANETAMTGRLVTFGIQPTEPATGYGYIEGGESLCDGARRIKSFIEKPPQDDAIEMLSAGRFYWNSGMFMFQVGTLLREMELHAEAVYVATESAVKKARQDIDFVRLDEVAFSQSPSISIDYAVMEKTDNGAVVPSPFRWSDLGSWDSVWKSSPRDQDGNAASANATLVDTKNSLVITQGVHLAVHGMEDVAVIASEDAVYVGRLDGSQSVGSVVKTLARLPSTVNFTEFHPTSYRPWGGYTSILSGERFQVKRIFVSPGSKLSLQKHHHRSEHWVVVKGTAEVTVGDVVRILRENESIYVPVGETHRLANPGKIMLELIEVQTGSYLGEDDIVRLMDEFGRT